MPSDAFTDPFNARPSRPSFLPEPPTAEEVAERHPEPPPAEAEDADAKTKLAKDEEEITQIVLVTNDKMRALRESAEYTMANLVRPAAQQALDTGKTVALVLGQKTLSITKDMAQELLESPWVIGLVLIGWFGSGNIPITQSVTEFWSTKALNYGWSMIGYPIPEVSQWAKYMLMAKDVGATLQVGVKTHFGMKFAKILAKEVGVLSALKNNVQHNDVKDLVAAQMDAIKALSGALQTQNVVAAGRHVSKLPLALRDEMSSDTDTNYGPVRDRRRALGDDKVPSDNGQETRLLRRSLCITN